MPESAVYLLFALGAVLVVGGIVRPHQLGAAAKPGGLRIRDRLRLGLLRYRRPGFVIGVIAVGLLWYVVSPSPAPDETVMEPAASPTVAAESAANRIYGVQLHRDRIARRLDGA